MHPHLSPGTVRSRHVAGAVEMSKIPVGWTPVSRCELPVECHLT